MITIQELPSQREKPASEQSEAESPRPRRFHFKNSVYEQSIWVTLAWTLLAVVMVVLAVVLSAP